MKLKTMSKNTSILVGEYFDDFINQQIETGKFSSLKKGERSGFIKDFNHHTFLDVLHQKHSTS
jgi:antitoxin ParD1/3/4